MKLFFAALFSFAACAAHAQSYFIVSGKVTNEQSGAPMPAASVFAQNTTMGTATDNDGNFSLTLPAGGYDLVVTFTGYVTETRRISSNDVPAKINVSMKEKEKELEAVAVVSSNEVKDGYAKYGEFFNAEFLGALPDSLQCRIQNPDALHFFFSKRRNRLKVTASEPLVIKNNLLGYNITYTLDSFVHEYNTQVSVYTGYPLFEEMSGDVAQAAQWETARRAAYRGSMLQFMRGLYNKTLRQQQFEVQFIVNNNGKDSALKLVDPYVALNYKKDDSTQTVEFYPNQVNTGILYYGEKPSDAYVKSNPGEPTKFEFSLLNFKPDDIFVIEQNGYFYEQNDVSVSGYWSQDKVAKQLPYDYRFAEE